MKFTKDEGSAFMHMVIVWMIFTIAIIITVYIHTMNLTSIVKNQLEKDLSIANLSAASIDIPNYTNTGKFSIIETKKAFNNFITTFTVNMGLESNGNNQYIPKNGSYFNGLISKISVLDFYIYTIDGTSIIQNKYQVTSDTVLTESYIDSEVSTPDGFNVKSPTVYSRVEVTLTLPGNITKTVTRENSVAVEIGY